MMQQAADIFSILIIDSDRKFLEMIHSDPKARAIPPVVATSSDEADNKIRDHSFVYAAIFINPLVSGKNGSSLLRLAHEVRPGTPIFLIHTGPSPFTPRELGRLAIHKAVQKPITYEKMAAMVSSEIFEAKPKSQPDKIDKPSTEDKSFVPIPAQQFLSGQKSFFDVYVRLASGRYLKIVPANETITPERLQNYLLKNVSHFYLHRSSQDRCLSYCDTLAAVLLTHNDVSAEMKVARALQEGSEILKSVRDNGLDELHCEYATAFIDNVRQLIPKGEGAQKGLVDNFLNNSSAYEHAVNTTLVASLLALPLKIEAESAYHTVGLAALLHDVGLSKLPPNCQVHDISQLNEEEKELYWTHADLSAEMMQSLRSIDSSTIQAVRQHHERRNGKGFPNGLKAGQINRVAEIIGIADEFVTRLTAESAQRKANPKYEALASMTEVFDSFSEPVIDAFQRIFMGKRSAPTAAAKRSPKKKKSK